MYKPIIITMRDVKTEARLVKQDRNSCQKRSLHYFLGILYPRSKFRAIIISKYLLGDDLTYKRVNYLNLSPSMLHLFSVFTSGNSKSLTFRCVFSLLVNMTEGDPAQLPKLSQLTSSGILGLKEGLTKVALPLQNAGLTGAVLGLKELVKKVVFNCPERHYKLYSLLFMFAPAVFLLCLALIVSRNFWKMVAGCCRLRRPQRRVVWQKSRKYVILSMVPPIAWILFALFDTEYYTCAKLGSKKIRLNNTAPFQQPALSAEYESAKIESRIIGIFLLTGIVLVGTVLISIE